MCLLPSPSLQQRSSNVLVCFWFETATEVTGEHMSDRDGCVVISEGIEVSGAIGRRTNVYLGRRSGATGGGGVASVAVLQVWRFRAFATPTGGVRTNPLRQTNDVTSTKMCVFPNFAF